MTRTRHGFSGNFNVNVLFLVMSQMTCLQCISSSIRHLPLTLLLDSIFDTFLGV